MAGPPSSQHLRRLVPRLTPQAGPATPPSIPQKREQTRIACDACRQHKSKCSGERPRCNTCVGRGTKCHYEATSRGTRLQAMKRKYNELQSQRSPYEKLFDLLKTVSEEDAQHILAKLRSGVDVDTLLSHVADADLLIQLSLVPETCYRYNFPYIATMPENLHVDDNPYLHSLIFEAAALYPRSRDSRAVQQSLCPQDSSSDFNNMPHVPEHQRAVHKTIYLKPFHAAKVVDARLSNVKISSWTSVCDDNTLMQDLLSEWLRCEYHFTAAFQKDLFLEDMATGRQDFCSPLLVNIILGYACTCYSRMKKRSEYWNPNTLAYRFIAEAKRLWELEANQPCITTVQAGILFNVFYNLCGLDEMGQSYRIQAIALAHRMRLFDSNTEGLSLRVRPGVAFTAWALFNWETLVGFSFMFAPLLIDPPGWCLPDPSKSAEWYGEIWMKYPLTDHLIPSYFGHVFKARSQFRVIMNKACQTAYSQDSEMTHENAYEILWRLNGWYDKLPTPLLPRYIVLPGHLQLHMYYYHLILTLFKPLLDAKTTQKPSPEQVVESATKYLYTLTRLYYLRHGYEAMDLFIVIPLMLAASDCIDALNEQTPISSLQTLQATLVLATKGLYNQRQNHYLAEALFRVVRGRMRPSEVALFKGMIKMDGDEVEEKPDMAQPVRSHWPVSVVKKKNDLESHILTNLVENYAHLNVEEESSPEGATKVRDGGVV